MDEERTRAPAVQERVVADAGYRVGDPFVAFYVHYGQTLCGSPISDVLVEDGVPTQYFRHLALEEPAPGRVRLKALGEAWLGERRAVREAPPGTMPAMVDVADRLPRHPSRRYQTRPLADIRYLVVHHTGAPAEVGVKAIAAEHVEANGWPGIGYHFVVDPDGTVFRTQDLTTVAFHARQFNPAALGVALIGDLSASLPPAAQLEATALLLAWLLGDLGLGPSAVRGHREMVPTPCPGESFLGLWKPRLLGAVTDRIATLDAVATPRTPVPADPSAA